MYVYNKLKYFFVLLLFIINSTGCKKLVEIDAPVTSSNAANVYTNDATATAVLTGIYAKISNLNFDLTNGSITGISLVAGLSADEISLFNLGNLTLPYYRNDLTSNTANLFWSSIYPLIFIANSAIEGLNSSSGLTPAVKQQLLGEAKFFRAFCYFYLVNLYGDVPLVVNTDYKQNVSISRTPKAQVYQQIIADLTDAQALLSANYLKSDALTAYVAGSEQRVRPTKWAATALLARVYLYTGVDYANAEVQATTVINNSSQFSLTALTDVFKMNSKETIWALQPVRVSPSLNTGEGALFILPAAGPNTSNYPVYLSNSMVSSFEMGDQRKISWMGSVPVGSNTYYYPYKYKIGVGTAPTAEYIMVLRVAEVYLIRAEARAQQNNIAGAQSDLNAIRSRAGLGATPANDKTALLAAILHERQVELFTEWGHRWFDLKRTNNIDAVMANVAVQKGGTWSPYKALYPIPQSEINLDVNLTQNPGY